MPISDNEAYTFHFDAIRGVTLVFITNRWPANSRLLVFYYVYTTLLLLIFRIIHLITLIILFLRLNIPLLENSELKNDCILLLIYWTIFLFDAQFFYRYLLLTLPYNQYYGGNKLFQIQISAGDIIQFESGNSSKYCYVARFTKGFSVCKQLARSFDWTCYTKLPLGRSLLPCEEIF
jgi:hypothetical protein